MGELPQALANHEQALPLSRAAGDRLLEAEVLHNIALTQDALGEKLQALDFYQQAQQLAHALGDRDAEAVTFGSIGNTYSDLSEPEKALDAFMRALNLYRALSDRSGQAANLNNIGNLYLGLGEPQKAVEYLKQALALYTTIEDRGNTAVVLGNVGHAFSDLGDKQSALDYYLKALATHRALGNRASEALTLSNIARIYGINGDWQKAIDYNKQALEVERAVGDRRTEATTLTNLGVDYEQTGESEKARDCYAQALSLRRAVEDPGGQATTLHAIAMLERNRGNLEEARMRIEEAITIIEGLRTRIANDELRSSYFGTVQGIYEFYIDLLMRLHKLHPAAGHEAEALQANERARARVLNEMLLERADTQQDIDPQFVAQERSLRQQLNARAQQQMQLLSRPHTEEQARAIAQEIEELTTRLQQVEATNPRPRYLALLRLPPLTLREIQTQLLAANTLLLEYTLGAERSYLWAVTPTSITSYELPPRAEIETAAREFYEFVHTSPNAATSGAATQRDIGSAVRQQAAERGTAAAAQLSRMLLAPVAATLGKKRLLIVADGMLQYIPFAALPAPTRLRMADGGWRNGNQRLVQSASRKSPSAIPLIVAHEIVSLPSASTLDLLRHKAGERKAATKTLVVLADPVFERTDERFKARARQSATGAGVPVPTADGSRGLGLAVTKAAQEAGVATTNLAIPRLPATRHEADAISALAPVAARRELLDFAASRAAATDPALADYRFVHFATHGLLDSEHPELSGILLSMFDERGAPQDGFLRAHEIYNLKLNADLVVLSACQTGLGKEIKGEGLVGLTRGFMYAGAPRVVVSLWSVNDAATAELMTRFYRGMLVDKLRPAQALQAAQVSMLNDRRFSAPFYWAAFTLQGEWR